MVKFRKDCPNKAWLDIGHIETDFDERLYDESVDFCKKKGQMLLPVKKESTVNELRRLFLFCDLKFWWVGLHFTKNVGTYSDGSKYDEDKHVKVIDFRVIDVEGGSSHVTCHESAYAGKDEDGMFYRQIYRAECDRFESATICVSDYRDNPDPLNFTGPTKYANAWLWKNDFPILIVIFCFILPLLIILTCIALYILRRYRKKQKEKVVEEEEIRSKRKVGEKRGYKRRKRSHESTEKFEIEQEERRQTKLQDKVKRKLSGQDNFFDNNKCMRRDERRQIVRSERSEVSLSGNMIEQFLKAPVFLPARDRC